MSSLPNQTPSAEVLRQQNQNLGDENRRLKAHRVGVADHLVQAVAEALYDAREAAAVSVAYGVLDDTSRTKPGSRPPGNRDIGAASALRGLETALGRAVNTYWSRRHNDWHRPETDQPSDKVRCNNRDCDRVNKRTPKEIRVGDSTIQLTHCPGCGSKLGTC